LLGTFSGLIFVGTFLLRDYFSETRLSKRFSRLVKESILSISGQVLAICMIVLGSMGLAMPVLVTLAWFGWFGCFLKVPFIVAEYFGK